MFKCLFSMCNYLEENINLRREMEDIFKSPSGISRNEKIHLTWKFHCIGLRVRLDTAKKKISINLKT